VRGEYDMKSLLSKLFLELPPRARRIRRTPARHAHQLGTTSACAENTFFTGFSKGFSLNYLRVRGEYVAGRDRRNFSWELPPRARRIRRPDILAMFPLGTTSACAENTW